MCKATPQVQRAEHTNYRTTAGYKLSVEQDEERTLQVQNCLFVLMKVNSAVIIPLPEKYRDIPS